MIEQAICVAVGFVAGWYLRGRLNSLAMTIAMRLLSSSIGKKRVAETLLRGFENMDKAK